MKFWAFIKDLFRSIGRHNVGMLAAAVSFFGFSAMIPLLLVIVFGATFFVAPAVVERLLSYTLHAVIPTLPSESSMLDESVKRLIALRASVSLFAVLGLLWTAVGGFVSFQQILDFIWGATKRRSFVVQYIVGFLVMTFFLLLTVAAALASGIPHLFAENLPPGTARADVWTTIALASRIAFPLLVFVTAFLSFRFLPSQPLRVRYLFTGAAVSTAAIFVSRLLFTWYLGHLGQYQMVYGALTFVMLLLFWIYIVSNIILICAEIVVCFARAAGTTFDQGVHHAKRARLEAPLRMRARRMRVR